MLMASVAAAQPSGCVFDYVAGDGLLASSFVEVTQELSKNANAVRQARAALPNFRRVFAAQAQQIGVPGTGGYTAIIGWADLPEDYSRYSVLQAERKFVETGELAKRTIHSGKDFSYETGFEMPLTMVAILNYLDGGERYRDIGMDVIATKNCMFSIKFSGARQTNDDAAWQAFGEEFGRIRSTIKSHEQPVAFSQTGKFFSFWGIVNVAMFATVAALIGTVIAFGLTRQYQITPGRVARRYSLAIIALCLLGLTVTGFIAFLIGTSFEPYDRVLLFLIILAIHFNAYTRQTPIAVLAAVSLVLGLFIASVVYMALGWRALPRIGEAVGMTIGLALVAYALVGTLSHITNNAEQPKAS